MIHMITPPFRMVSWILRQTGNDDWVMVRDDEIALVGFDPEIGDTRYWVWEDCYLIEVASGQGLCVDILPAGSQPDESLLPSYVAQFKSSMENITHG